MGSEKQDTKSTFALYTERSRKVVVVAQDEARSMEHRYLGTEHLLLGLLRVEGGVGYRALSALSVGLEDVRGRVRRGTSRVSMQIS